MPITLRGLAVRAAASGSLQRRPTPFRASAPGGRRRLSPAPPWSGPPEAPSALGPGRRRLPGPHAVGTDLAVRWTSSAAAAVEAAAPAAVPQERARGSGEVAPRNKIIDSPMRAYDQLIARGQIVDDRFQRSVVKVLENLHETVSTHTFPPVAPPAKKPDTMLARFAFALGKKLSGDGDGAAPARYGPRGLYLHGTVGTGKTMLMNLFYDTLHHVRKRRVHFHAFMLDVHMRVHKLKSSAGAHYDPIPPIAAELTSQASVLCFDEFQVTDIADAMILRRLLDELFRLGIVVVTTSNRHPDELYQNGIQRQSFIPCIELLKERCRVVDLNSGRDYRRMEREAGEVFFTPLGPETTKKMEALFAELTKGKKVTRKKLKFIGRSLEVRKQAGGVAWFTFDELCAQPLSAADYLAIAKKYSTVMVSDIPKLSLAQRNEARRFITALDALYESHATLVLSSEASIFDMFCGDAAGASRSGGGSVLTDAQRLLMDDLGLTTSGGSGSRDDANALRSALFSGEEEVFAFQRAVSRLVEMCSKEWVERRREARIAAAGIPGGDGDDEGIDDHGEEAMNLSEEDEPDDERPEAGQGTSQATAPR